MRSPCGEFYARSASVRTPVSFSPLMASVSQASAQLIRDTSKPGFWSRMYPDGLLSQCMSCLAFRVDVCSASSDKFCPLFCMRIFDPFLHLLGVHVGRFLHFVRLVCCAMQLPSDWLSIKPISSHRSIGARNPSELL